MRIVLVGALLACVAMALACSVREEVITQDIVTTIPWSDQEEAHYTIYDKRGEEEQGTGVLTAELQGDQYELTLKFEGVGDKAGTTDDTTVLVDPTTLKAVRMERTIVTNGETQAVRAEYDAVVGVVNITEINEGGDERLVPLRLKDNYYDNDTSLYLWRTIELQEDFVAHYRAIIAGNRTEVIVTLAVKQKEQITVPAGAFEAWRVEIHSKDLRQVAWIADTPQHPIVQYQNGKNQLLKLTSITEP